MRGVDKGKSRCALPIEWAASRILIVNDEDIHDVQIPPF
jgi:hypothetical protein